MLLLLLISNNCFSQLKTAENTPAKRAKKPCSGSSANESTCNTAEQGTCNPLSMIFCENCLLNKYALIKFTNKW